MKKNEFDKAVQDFVKHFRKKYPPKKNDEEKHRSRFDKMSPERLQFWIDEHS